MSQYMMDLCTIVENDQTGLITQLRDPLNLATFESQCALDAALHDFAVLQKKSFPPNEKDDVVEFAREVAMKARNLSLILRAMSSTSSDSLRSLLKVLSYLASVVWPKYRYYTLEDEVRGLVRSIVSRKVKDLDDTAGPQGLGHLKILAWLVEMIHNSHEHADFQYLLSEMVLYLKQSSKDIWSSHDTKEILHTGLKIWYWIPASSKDAIVVLISGILSSCASEEEILDAGFEKKNSDVINIPNYWRTRSNVEEAQAQIISLALNLTIASSMSVAQHESTKFKVSLIPSYQNIAMLTSDHSQYQVPAASSTLHSLVIPSTILTMSNPWKPK